MRIAHAPGVTHAIEELQDLDGALAAESEGIPKTGGVDVPLRARGRDLKAGDLRLFSKAELPKN